jgi:anti-sigma B factor antagonist
MLTYSRTDDLCQAHIEGPMTIHNAFELKTAFMDAMFSAPNFELDLSAVTEMDAAGLQILIMAKQHQAKNQHQLILLRHSEAVLDALELMGLVTWFSDPVVIPRQ